MATKETLMRSLINTSVRWLALLCLLALLQPALASDWSGFYDRATLEKTRRDMTPGIEENLREVIWPKLTPAERAGLSGLTWEYPLSDDKSLMNFYAYPGQQRVQLPISGLRFLADICLAYAWLNAKGMSVLPVAHYAATLKYRWPDPFAGRPHQPLAVLGVPLEAKTDERVQRDFQRLFGSAVVFLLGHELGHVLHRGRVPATGDARMARVQEEIEADRFALELLRRIGDPPMGALPLFMVWSHMASFSSDPGHAQEVDKATHPTSASRLRAAAEQIKQSTSAYARTGTPPQVLIGLSVEMGKLAGLLADPGLQESMRKIGLGASWEDLQPRPASQLSNTRFVKAVPDATFTGTWRGTWSDHKNINLPVMLTLEREGARVRGRYDFGMGDIEVDGLVDSARLHYKWSWGPDHFGRGVLELQADGGLRGTWGYTEKSEGGGRWQLQAATR